MPPRAPLDPAACDMRLRPRQEDVRGPYFRDQTAIIHSNSFRRLKHKTQVFFAPENDHVCTRIEHVLHVATIAATICRGLNQRGWQLDTELAYAAGLGHDIGHAPFGHTGERVLNELLKPSGAAFSHESHSLRVLNLLENHGRGLNLTRGVRDAILCHNGERFEQYLGPESVPRLPEDKQHDPHRLPATWEGCIVRLCDKIAYLGRDLEDALLAEFVRESDVPPEIRKELGDSNGHIINTLVLDLIENAALQGKIGFSDAKHALFLELYDFNVRGIYQHDRIRKYESYCGPILKALYEHLMTVDPDQGIHDREPLEFEHRYIQQSRELQEVYAAEHAGRSRQVVDYLAGMTDNFALRCYTQLTIPQPIEFPWR